MNNQDEQLEVRKMAVEHHHAEAKRFVGWYEEMEKSRFANAFAYGRHKVDVLLDETLKELAGWRTHSGCRLWNRRICPSCERTWVHCQWTGARGRHACSRDQQKSGRDDCFRRGD